jgi:hypothetical protein
LVRLIQHYGTPFFGHQLLGTTWIGVGAILYLVLSLIGGLALIRRQRRLAPLVVYPFLYLAVFAVRNPLMFRWYLAPMLPMYLLSVLYGVRRVGLDLSEALRSRWRSVRHAAWVAGGVLWLAAMTSLVLAWEVHPDHGPDRPAPEMAWFRLEQLYRQATLDLMARYPVGPETVIAAGDIGMVGYSSGARILDTLGLVSPQSTGYYPLPEAAYEIIYAVPTELILDQQPDYIILLEVYIRNTLLRSPSFMAGYELVHGWPCDIYGSEAMLVFRRSSRASQPSHAAWPRRQDHGPPRSTGRPAACAAATTLVCAHRG